MTNRTPDIIRLRQLARQLRIPVVWLKKEAEDGRLPHLKVGRQLLFNMRAVERALAERAAQEGKR